MISNYIPAFYLNEWINKHEESMMQMLICRFSSIIKTRGIRLSFANKQKLREDLKRVKEMSRAIKAQKQAEKEAKKQRRRDNLKRAEENRKKGEIVQVVSKYWFHFYYITFIGYIIKFLLYRHFQIKNPAKIKRMKKKQLRMIEKRDTTNM